MLFDNREQLNQLSRKFETSMFELRNLEYRRMQSSSKDEIAEIEKSMKTVTDEMHVFQNERRAIIEQEEDVQEEGDHVVDDRIYRAHREMGNVQGPHAVICCLKEYLEENPDDKKVSEVYELFNASNKLLEIASGLLDKIM